MLAGEQMAQAYLRLRQIALVARALLPVERQTDLWAAATSTADLATSRRARPGTCRDRFRVWSSTSCV
jgi:hypothetical protein